MYFKKELCCSNTEHISLPRNRWTVISRSRFISTAVVLYPHNISCICVPRTSDVLISREYVGEITWFIWRLCSRQLGKGKKMNSFTVSIFRGVCTPVKQRNLLLNLSLKRETLFHLRYVRVHGMLFPFNRALWSHTTLPFQFLVLFVLAIVALTWKLQNWWVQFSSRHFLNNVFEYSSIGESTFHF